MIRPPRIWSLLLVAAVALGPALVSAPAEAASGACTSASGVTVVVDFGPLGGGVQVHCAHTTGTGLDALKAAGYSVTGTQRWGSAFVCRIDNLPGPSVEKCDDTPPTSSSWHYWHAGNGGPWIFSQSGATSRKVVQGGFEGWSFGGGAAPGYTPRRRDSSGGSGSDSGPGGSVITGEPSSAGDAALPQPKPRTGDADAGTATPGPTPSPTGPPTLDPSHEAVASQDSASSITPWIAGGLLLALLAGIIITVRRRSH